MNGSAPNSPETGSQISVRQKSNPNWRIDSIDCETSSKPMAHTIRIEGERKDACPQPEAQILFNHRPSTSSP